MSYPDSGSYKFTFAEERDTDYLDWFTYDSTGIDYTSYFITGYKIRGQAMNKSHPLWVNVFSNTSEAVKYYFQTIWDYALTGSGTGRWSSKSLVQHTDTDYAVTPRRLKVRGRGKAMQFKVQSITGQPFHIIGWSTFDIGNQLP